MEDRLSFPSGWECLRLEVMSVSPPPWRQPFAPLALNSTVQSRGASGEPASPPRTSAPLLHDASNQDARSKDTWAQRNPTKPVIPTRISYRSSRGTVASKQDQAARAAYNKEKSLLLNEDIQLVINFKDSEVKRLADKHGE